MHYDLYIIARIGRRPGLHPLAQPLWLLSRKMARRRHWSGIVNAESLEKRIAFLLARPLAEVTSQTGSVLAEGKKSRRHFGTHRAIVIDSEYLACNIVRVIDRFSNTQDRSKTRIRTL